MLVADNGIDHLVTLIRDTEQLFSLEDYYKEFPGLTDDDVIRELSRAGA